MLPRNYLLLAWLGVECPCGRGVPRALGTDLRTPLLPAAGTDLRTPLLPAQPPPSWLCPKMPAVGTAPLLLGRFGAGSWEQGGAGQGQPQPGPAGVLPGEAAGAPAGEAALAGLGWFWDAPGSLVALEVDCALVVRIKTDPKTSGKAPKDEEIQPRCLCLRARREPVGTAWPGSATVPPDVTQKLLLSIIHSCAIVCLFYI